jgi:hypothetical protein
MGRSDTCFAAPPRTEHQLHQALTRNHGHYAALGARSTRPVESASCTMLSNVFSGLVLSGRLINGEAEPKTPGQSKQEGHWSLIEPPRRIPPFPAKDWLRTVEDTTHDIQGNPQETDSTCAYDIVDHQRFSSIETAQAGMSTRLLRRLGLGHRHDTTRS